MGVACICSVHCVLVSGARVGVWVIAGIDHHGQQTCLVSMHAQSTFDPHLLALAWGCGQLCINLLVYLGYKRMVLDLNFITGTDIRIRIDELQRQFRDLHRRLVSELKERVSVEEVLAELTLLQIEFKKEYESSIQQMLPTLEEVTRITTLMNRLNPLFTFIDYGLLDHLITNLGSKELKEDMTSYVERVHEFMLDTTVGEVMDCWPGDEEPHVDFKMYSLERLNNFRRKFCSKVRLSEFIFCLISLEPAESFYATWLIPTVVVPEVMKAVRQIDEHFYKLDRVLSISVGQEQLYPLPSNGAASATSTIIKPFNLDELAHLLSMSVGQEQLFPLSGNAKPSVTVSESVYQKLLPGDLFTPTPSLVNSAVKQTQSMKLKSPTDDHDLVNIITIGCEYASHYASAIIGNNVGDRVKLWDFSQKEYDIEVDIDKIQFESEKVEELRTNAQRCPTADLVVIVQQPVVLDKVRSEPASFFSKMRVVHTHVHIGLSISDITTLFGSSVWSNAVVVQPFVFQRQDLLWYRAFVKMQFVKLCELQSNNIDPEVISNIPILPINIDLPKLPDHIDWLSPLWDTCLIRMKKVKQNAFLRANADRITLSTAGKQREDGRKHVNEQAILYVPGSDTSNDPIRSAVSNLLGTEVAGPLGTTKVQKFQS